MAEEFTGVHVQSMYGAKTHLPYVSLQIGDLKPVQMSPDEARIVAGNMMGAAEAAEQDAFMIGWLQDKFQLSLQQAGAILLEFREARKAGANAD